MLEKKKKSSTLKEIVNNEKMGKHKGKTRPKISI